MALHVTTHTLCLYSAIILAALPVLSYTSLRGLTAFLGLDWAAATKLTQPKRARTPRAGVRSFAYVTMWYKAEGLQPELEGDALKRVLGIARALHMHKSKYPLIVLTNSDAMQDMFSKVGPGRGNGSEHNAVVWQISRNDTLNITCSLSSAKPHWVNTFQKLRIFSIAGFDKLLWLDSDITIHRNIDYTFDLSLERGRRVYAQEDDWRCNGRPVSSLCSGALLFRPSPGFQTDIVNVLNTYKRCPASDQHLLERYFPMRNVSIEYFSNVTISFSKCFKRTHRETHMVHHAWGTRRI